MIDSDVITQLVKSQLTPYIFFYTTVADTL